MNKQSMGDDEQTPTMSSTTPSCSAAVGSVDNTDANTSIRSTTTPTRDISPRMREEDADLLESMHYASSQVSQYTPDGTPLLRPKDRSLPMEDVPLISMPIASTSELLMKKENENDVYVNSSIILSDGSQSSTLNKESRGVAGRTRQQPKLENSSSEKVDHLSLPELANTSKNFLSTLKDSERLTKTPPKLKYSKSQDGSIRRLLSGEIRTVIGGEQQVDDDFRPNDDNSSIDQQPASRILLQNEKDYETNNNVDGEPNRMSISTASTIKTEQDGLAQRRRVSEALQFAQAVGEDIALNRDDLCIIDDDEDDDDDDDDDDDENAETDESKERAAMNTSIHENMLAPEYFIGITPVTPKKVKQTLLVDHETPLIDRSIAHSPKLDRRRKTRPTWPFEQHSEMEFGFMNHLSDGAGDRTNFVYKGICANPPEITKRGIQRGNYAQLHRKAWLEVSDKYHRYGKNLRLYYRLWERLGFPTNQFFDWLDSKGEAAGQPLPNIDECPRSVLDSDTVLYITNPNVTERYALGIVVGDDGRGLVVDVDGDPVNTGPDGWIFILRDNAMYGAPKVTSVSGHSKQRFHHSSFFGGKAVASAGIIITDNQGYLTRLYPHSGHYRPGEAHMQRMLFFLHKNGVDLRSFEMDTQQLLHVSREKEDPKKKSGKGKVSDNSGDGKTSKGKEEKKVKKVDSLHLEKAVDVACFLAHKADFIGKGLFDKIHKIRKADVASVSEALNLVNANDHLKTGNAGK